MPKVIKIAANSVVFVLGAAALVHTDFWDWNLVPGLWAPLAATAFLLYLTVLLFLGGSKDPADGDR
jgi:hypothetical protein